MALAQKDLVNQLNHAMPANMDAQLGSVIEELQQKLNALLLKLDADQTVTDTNYSSLLKVSPLSTL